MQLRRSQSMDYDDPTETEESDQKRVFKLLSETDIQVACEIEFSQVFVVKSFSGFWTKIVR